MKIVQPNNNNTGCGPTNFPKASPIKLPENFKILNNGYENFQPEEVEEKTRKQSNSALWFKLRACRLTASNFGRVLLRKATPTEKCLNNLFSKSSVRAIPLDYGKGNESKAKSKYLEVFTSRHIHDCGLVINKEFIFLGATPDGKVCENGKCGIIEIKCPYTARNYTIEQAVRELPDFMLKENTNGEVLLDKRHPNYAQVQGQLMITGAEFCDFIVYTPKDLYVKRLFPDINYMENMINILSSFFKEHAQPYLSAKKVLSNGEPQ